MGKLALLLFALQSAAAQYPAIERLDASDELYRQQQEDLRTFYRNLAAERELPPLLIYRYHTREQDTLFGIAARLSVPYAAVATLNRMPGPQIGAPREILLPGIPGVFVPIDPSSDLEAIMSESRIGRDGQVITVALGGGAVRFRYFAGEDFLPDERLAFLGLLFRRPVSSTVVSSPYGMRRHPLTGEWTLHAGVDFPAATGTPVVAARAGTVAGIGYDERLGNFVLLAHAAGYSTFYGHLHAVSVTLNQEVSSGMILGTVGSTGVSTGSHLHFEIRENGVARDPLALLP